MYHYLCNDHRADNHDNGEDDNHDNGEDDNHDNGEDDNHDNGEADNHDKYTAYNLTQQPDRHCGVLKPDKSLLD